MLYGFDIIYVRNWKEGLYMVKKHRFLEKDDFVFLTMLIIISGILLFFSLNKGHNWGDDFSVYISQGIALSEGTFKEQAVKNGQILSRNEPFVYVWGYPLLLAVVHKIVGFDYIDYSNIIYYKIPSALCLVLLGIAIYLYFRRRMGKKFAFLSALFFSANPLLISLTNEILTDICFAATTTFALLLMDYYIDSLCAPNKKTIILGLFLGGLIYLAQIVRYVGAALLIVLLIAQAIWCVKDKNRKHGVIPEKKAFLFWASRGIPYISFILLYMFVGTFMPYAKSQASDVFQVTLKGLIVNVVYYITLVYSYINSIMPISRAKWLIVLFFVVAFAGVIVRFFDETPAALYLIGTAATVVLLPYQQGLRYILNILPLIVLFFIHGLTWLYQCVCKNRHERLLSKLALGFSCITCIFMLNNSIASAKNNMQNERMVSDGAYSKDAVMMYRFIQDEIGDDEVISFAKARALSLNTKRVCLLPFTNEPITKIDYLLLSSEPAALLRFDLNRLTSDNNILLEEYYRSGSMVLYRLRNDND